MSVFSAFGGLRIAVVGDVMLDRYLYGRVDRVSPEAPVPVVDLKGTDARPGGAANVALNLKALGAQPLLAGVVGADAHAEELKALLTVSGIETTGLLADPARPTTTKTRIVAGSQQLLRLDEELKDDLNAQIQAGLLDWLQAEAAKGLHGILLQDYNKGVLTTGVIARCLALAAELGVPTLVDPKHRHFFEYKGCTVFKPNLKELSAALGQPLHGQAPAGLAPALGDLQNRMPHEYTLLTLSEHGVLLAPAQGPLVHLPAHRRHIADVSGAGDTVAATMLLAMAAGWLPARAAALANLAGGLVCEQPGVVPPDVQRLAEEAVKHGLDKD